MNCTIEGDVYDPYSYGYTVMFSSECISAAVFAILFFQFCYAGYKIARQPSVFIVSVWLMFFLSIILFLGYWALKIYWLTEDPCNFFSNQSNMDFAIYDAAEIMSILGLLTFAYHYHITTKAVKEI
jgi:hypothetical protein